MDFASADPALFDKMFSTFKILKQSPAYTAAMSDSSVDMRDLATVRLSMIVVVVVVGRGGEERSSISATASGIGWGAYSDEPLTFLSPLSSTFLFFSKQQKGKVLADAVGQFANLAVNLRGGMASVNAEKGGINNKVLEFLQKGDEETLALAQKVKEGDSAAIWDLQQAFMNTEFPGLNIRELADDDFVMAARKFFVEDKEGRDLANLIGEENTLSVLMDENLLFKNNPTFGEF